jgi:hypothetical protein
MRAKRATSRQSLEDELKRTITSEFEREPKLAEEVSYELLTREITVTVYEIARAVITVSQSSVGKGIGPDRPGEHRGNHRHGPDRARRRGAPAQPSGPHCLMPNNVHLIVTPTDADGPSVTSASGKAWREPPADAPRRCLGGAAPRPRAIPAQIDSDPNSRQFPLTPIPVRSLRLVKRTEDAEPFRHHG